MFKFFVCVSLFLFLSHLEPASGIRLGIPARKFLGHQSVVRIVRKTGMDQEYAMGVLITPQLALTHKWIEYFPERPIVIPRMYKLIIGGDIEFMGEKTQIRWNYGVRSIRTIGSFVGVILSGPFVLGPNLFPAVMQAEPMGRSEFVAMSFGGSDPDKRQEFSEELMAVQMVRVAHRTCHLIYGHVDEPQFYKDHVCMQTRSGYILAYQDFGAPVFDVRTGIYVGQINFNLKPLGNPSFVNVVLVAELTQEIKQSLRFNVAQHIH